MGLEARKPGISLKVRIRVGWLLPVSATIVQGHPLGGVSPSTWLAADEGFGQSVAWIREYPGRFVNLNESTRMKKSGSL